MDLFRWLVPLPNYDWRWDYDNDPEDENNPEQPYNFKWRDLKVWWYKWFSRDLETNRLMSPDEVAEMLDECLIAIQAIKNDE